LLPREKGRQACSAERGELLFRLAVEPRRMWRRYLLGNPVFLQRVIEERRERVPR